MKPWTKIFAFLAVGFATLELLWLVAANRYLKSRGFQELLQRGGLKISYEDVSTILPGFIHVKDLTLESQDARLELAEARLQLSLLALAGKRILFWSADGEGGFLAFEPAPLKTDGQPSPNEDPVSKGQTQDETWSVHFQKLSFKNLQSIKVGSFKAQGSMDVAAELHIAGKDRVSIEEGRLQVRGVTTQWKEQTLATIEQLQGRFSLDPFIMKDELLRKLSLDLAGAVELEDGRVLQNFIVDAPWLQIQGLNMKSKGRLVLRQGQLVEPTQLAFESPNLQLELWKEIVSGHGTFTMNVEKDVKLQFSIPRFTIDHETKGAVDVSGRDLSLKLATEDRDLLSRDRSWQAALVLPESTIHDLRYFNHFLPQGLGFQFRSGQGKVQLHLDSASTRGNFIRVDAPDALVTYEKQEFRGRIHQELNIAAIDFVQEGFTVPTGELDVKLRPTRNEKPGADWTGTLSLRQGRIGLTPSRFEGLMKVTAKDLRPLLWIFDPKSKLPDWSRKYFSKDGLKAQFHLKADEESYSIDSFKAETDELKLEAWFQGSKAGKRGKLYMRYGAISAGIAVHDDQFQVQLLSSREWFQNRQ